MKKLIPIVLIAVALFFIFNDGSGDNIFGGDKHGSSGKVLGSSELEKKLDGEKYNEKNP